MNLRRMFYLAVLVALGAGLGTNAFAQPIFENNTPAGFSPSDSTKSPNFVIEKEVTVQVDLNQPATFSYPVVGNFQKLERSVPYDNTPQTAAYMSQAVAVDVGFFAGQSGRRAMVRTARVSKEIMSVFRSGISAAHALMH